MFLHIVLNFQGTNFIKSYEPFDTLIHNKKSARIG